MKEKVFVYVPGAPFGIDAGSPSVFLGPNTHMRSEGAWMLGVALNMARHGHDVTIFEYPWGDQNRYPLPNNVKLQREIAGECDIFIDIGWEEVHAVARFSRIRAKHYIHGWAGDPRGCSFLQYVTDRGLKNHYMARTSRCFRKYFDSFPYSVYMPTPLVEKIKSQPNFDSRKMLWGNRGAFVQSYSGNSEKVLGFMERHPEYGYTVLLYGDVKEKASQIGRSDIIDRFERLKNRRLLEPYYGIPHDEFLRELDASKILLANGQPSAHPQTLEAVCYGCVPLIWTFAEHHFQTPDGVNVNETYGCKGVDGIDQILEDRDRFNAYYRSLSTVTKDHEYDNAYNIFMEQLRGKEDG